LELEVNLATVMKEVTTSQVAPHWRCIQLQWQMTNGRAECDELKEVPQHHAARGGVLEIQAPSVKVIWGHRIWAHGDKSKRGHMATL